jgi:hypothetical protein
MSDKQVEPEFSLIGSVCCPKSSLQKFGVFAEGLDHPEGLTFEADKNLGQATNPARSTNLRHWHICRVRVGIHGQLLVNQNR